MAGHGSAPAEDRARHPGRQVDRMSFADARAAGMPFMDDPTIDMASLGPERGPLHGPYTEAHALATPADPLPRRRR